MKNFNRKSLIGTLAIAACMTAPLAFAQSETEAAPQEETMQQEAPTAEQAPAAAPAEAAAPTAAAPANGGAMSWNDVDGDKDGVLSKEEASTVPALGQVFDQADGDADGSLTPEEYKTFVAAAQAGGSAGAGGQ